MDKTLEQAKTALAVADEITEKVGPDGSVHLMDRARTLALLSIAESLVDIRMVLHEGTIAVETGSMR